MHRDLYLQALRRISELELDGNSLQNLVQCMQDVRMTMVRSQIQTKHKSHKIPCDSTSSIFLELGIVYIVLLYLSLNLACVLTVLQSPPVEVLMYLLIDCTHLPVQQASLSCDTDVALSNMKDIGDLVKDDHQSIVSHVRKQVSSFHHVCEILDWLSHIACGDSHVCSFSLFFFFRSMSG